MVGNMARKSWKRWGMHALLLGAVSLGALVLAGCEKERRKDAHAANSAASAADEEKPTEEKAGAEPKVSAVEKAAAAVGLADGLPDLKPVIDEPFPEGATEEQVCEAINDTDEKDLWVRFGHILPMHVPNTIFIVEAKKEDTAALERVVDADQTFAQYKNCRDEKTLIYARGMPERTREVDGIITGRIPLIKRFSEKAGIETLESFTSCSGQEAHDACQERLSDYCRADAELCEKLVKLDYANQDGLCNRGVHAAGSDASKEQHLKICEKLPLELPACTYFAWSPAEKQEKANCKCRLRRAYGLPHDSCD